MMMSMLAAFALEIPYPDIDPVFFSIGPLPIRWYALAYITGIVLGWVYAVRLLKRDALWQGRHAQAAPMSREMLDDLIFWVTIGIILGGRLGYVLFYKPALIIAPWEQIAGPLYLPPAIMLWQGGMSFHGGMLGVTIAGFFFARRHGLRFFSVADLFAVAAPIGLFFGRIANFINGELYGRPTDAPWAMVFPTDPAQLARHPSQLYEAFLEGLVLFAILAVGIWTFRILRKPGVATGIFLAGYGISRIIVEIFREPDAHMPDFPLGITMGMILSLPMVLLGAWLIWQGWNGKLAGPVDSHTSGKKRPPKPASAGLKGTPEDGAAAADADTPEADKKTSKA